MNTQRYTIFTVLTFTLIFSMMVPFSLAGYDQAPSPVNSSQTVAPAKPYAPGGGATSPSSTPTMPSGSITPAGPIRPSGNPTNITPAGDPITPAGKPTKPTGTITPSGDYLTINPSGDGIIFKPSTSNGNTVVQAKSAQMGSSSLQPPATTNAASSTAAFSSGQSSSRMTPAQEIEYVNKMRNPGASVDSVKGAPGSDNSNPLFPKISPAEQARIEGLRREQQIKEDEIVKKQKELEETRKIIAKQLASRVVCRDPKDPTTCVNLN